MNKLNLSPVLAATVAATVCANPTQVLAQNTVNFTNAAPILLSGSGDHTIAFSQDIPNADELLSISGGTVSGGEGGAFTLSVEYATSAKQQIFSDSWSSPPGGFSLNTLPVESFTPGDITGLDVNLVNTGFGAPQLTIPAGTVFAFDVIPEPASGALLVLGLAGIWAFTRRKAN